MDSQQNYHQFQTPEDCTFSSIKLLFFSNVKCCLYSNAVHCLEDVWIKTNNLLQVICAEPSKIAENKEEWKHSGKYPCHDK